MIEKVLSLGQIFEIEILMELHVLGSSEYENNIYGSSSMCVVRITQKTFIAETPNLVLYSTFLLYGYVSGNFLRSSVMYRGM